MNTAFWLQESLSQKRPSTGLSYWIGRNPSMHQCGFTYKLGKGKYFTVILYKIGTNTFATLTQVKSIADGNMEIEFTIFLAPTIIP